MANPLQSGRPRPPVVIGERAPRIKFPTRVLRIRLLYSDGQWSTVTSFVIDRKTLPQGHVIPKEGRRGFWYELRDRRGKLLYSRKVVNPFDPSHELFEPDGTITRVEMVRKTVYVELLVPDLPAAIEVRVLSDVGVDGRRLRQPEPIHVEAMEVLRKDDDKTGGGRDGNK